MYDHSEVKGQAEPQVCAVPAGHSQITNWYPAHTFPSLPGMKPVRPVWCNRHSACGRGEAKWGTLAVSHCLVAWLSCSHPPLCSHQEMYFSNSFSSTRNSSTLSSDKALSTSQHSLYLLFLLQTLGITTTRLLVRTCKATAWAAPTVHELARVMQHFSQKTWMEPRLKCLDV